MKQLNLRIDDDLHARLKAAATQDQRSLNREIMWLLERALDTREDRQEGRRS